MQMSGPPPPPQALILGSNWPLSHAEQYAELAFQRVARTLTSPYALTYDSLTSSHLADEQGFPACKWSERHDGQIIHGYQCNHGHVTGERGEDDWCPFVFKISTIWKTGITTTSQVDLLHDHRLEPTDSSLHQKYQKQAAFVIQDIEAELAKLAEERFSELKRADSFREGFENTESKLFVTRARQQEILVWDLAVALGKQKAQEFEQKMVKADLLARVYPTAGALKGHSPYSFCLAQDLPTVPSTPLSANSGTALTSNSLTNSSTNKLKATSKKKGKGDDAVGGKAKKGKNPFCLASTSPKSSSLKPLKSASTSTPSHRNLGESAEFEHSTDAVLVLRHVEDLAPSMSKTSTGPSKHFHPSAPSTSSTISTASSQPRRTEPFFRTDEGIAPSEFELKTRAGPAAGQVSRKGLCPSTFPGAVEPGSNVSSPLSCADPSFANLLSSPDVLERRGSRDSASSAPDPALVPLFYYLSALADSYAPPFADKFPSIGHALAQQGITDVPKLIFAADVDLDGLEAALKGTVPAFLLGIFWKSMLKRLAELRAKGEM
ncbi:hypothetical protein JCM11251_002557 [Rhodosporidiobolus azoricus]